MKRSEVLKLIEGLFNIAMAGNNELPSDVHAENLLCHLEEVGMLPPSSKFFDPGHFTGDDFSFYANVWEDESET
jgi:hypothetical protein